MFFGEPVTLTMLEKADVLSHKKGGLHMGSVSKVYFTKDISPESVVRLYDILGKSWKEMWP